MNLGTDIAFKASWLERVTGGRSFGDPHGDAVSTDSRSLSANTLFVALKGPSFDGHMFAEECLQRNASGVVVNESWWSHSKKNISALVVSDTLKALQDIARAHRLRFSIPMVAVTGSNGKTSTKEFVAAFLRPLGSVHKNRGNLNNHVGVPLTLLDLAPEHDVSVVELGMNHPGEIDLLSRLAGPQVAVITNVSAAHLQGLGDRVGVARAKAEIVAGVDPQGVLITPHGDDDLETALSQVELRRITVGMQDAATFRWDPPQVTTDGTRFRVFGPGIAPPGIPITTRLLGFHLAQNITLALAAASVLGVSPHEAGALAPQVPSVPGRLQLKRWGGLMLLDDTYNSNPESLRQALAVLKALPGKQHLAVVGDMLELGPQAEALHRQVVEGVVLDGLVTFGTLSRVMGDAIQSKQWLHTTDHQAAADSILEWAGDDTVVLLKGSRGMQLEKVLDAIGLGLGGTPDVV